MLHHAAYDILKLEESKRVGMSRRYAVLNLLLRGHSARVSRAEQTIHLQKFDAARY